MLRVRVCITKYINTLTYRTLVCVRTLAHLHTHIWKIWTLSKWVQSIGPSVARHAIADCSGPFLAPAQHSTAACSFVHAQSVAGRVIIHIAARTARNKERRIAQRRTIVSLCSRGVCAAHQGLGFWLWSFVVYLSCVAMGFVFRPPVRTSLRRRRVGAIAAIRTADSMHARTHNAQTEQSVNSSDCDDLDCDCGAEGTARARGHLNVTLVRSQARTRKHSAAIAVTGSRKRRSAAPHARTHALWAGRTNESAK